MNHYRGGYDEVDRYRRARARWDAEPVRHERSYAERPRYAESYDRTHPYDRDVMHGDVRRASDLRECQRRALADRELARDVDRALYDLIGYDADAIAVYAADGVVTIEGTLPHERAAAYVLDSVRHMPGVRRVRNALRFGRR